jgi:hypothetical protein
MGELLTTRREMMTVPLFAAAFAMFRAESVKAAGVDPTMTMITPPDQIHWQELYNFPKGAAETAPMFGKVSEPGQYFVLIRWHPGFMSAPHWYETDRLCVVLSGTWWCASGEDFAPEATVPVKAGSFVRRVAKTPPLRRRKEDRHRTRDHRHQRHRPHPVPLDRSYQAGLAGGIGSLLNGLHMRTCACR